MVTFKGKLSTVKSFLGRHKLTKTIPTVVIIALLTLPVILSHGAVAASASTSSSATSTEQLLTDYTAQYIGQVNVAALPTPTEGTVTPLSLPDLSLSTQQQVGTDPPAPIVTPGSQSLIHIVKDFTGTPGTNPNPCRCTPPDMGLAASARFVVQMVNLAGTIWKNNGVLVKTFSLSDFWFLPVRGGPLGIGMSDPLVLYDAAADRFYASIIDTFDVNRVNFAVTATNDPTGAWFIYRVSARGTPTAPYGPCSPASSNTLPDQPYIGYSSDKFLIAANDFDETTGLFIGAQYWILNKAEMLSGCTVPTPCPGGRNIDALTNVVTMTNNHWAIRPAQHLSTTSTAYMAENCLHLIDGVAITNNCTPPPPNVPPPLTNGGINVFTISGTPPGPTTVTVTTLTVAKMSFPGRADQPGNAASLGTNDALRMLSIVWRNNLLWTASHEGCMPTGDTASRTCARLDQIDTTTSTPTLVPGQDFDLGFSGAYVFYPALSTDSSNNLVLLYARSSLSLFPTLEVTGRLATMPPATLGASALLIAGSAADYTGRWGDYFWAATDPATPNTFWVSGEYRTVSLFQGWSTQVGEISFNPT